MEYGYIIWTIYLTDNVSNEYEYRYEQYVTFVFCYFVKYLFFVIFKSLSESFRLGMCIEVPHDETKTNLHIFNLIWSFKEQLLGRVAVSANFPSIFQLYLKNGTNCLGRRKGRCIFPLFVSLFEGKINRDAHF